MADVRYRDIPVEVNPHHPDFDPSNPVWAKMTIPEAAGYMHVAMSARIAEGMTAHVGVGGGEESAAYTYTVGRGAIFGLPDIVAVGMLNGSFVEWFACMTDPPMEVGQRYKLDGYEAVLAPVPDEVYRTVMLNAVRHGGIGGVQVLWQDDEHRWPWDEGHERLRLIADHGVDYLPIYAGDHWRPSDAEPLPTPKSTPVDETVLGHD